MAVFTIEFDEEKLKTYDEKMSKIKELKKEYQTRLIMHKGNAKKCDKDNLMKENAYQMTLLSMECSDIRQSITEKVLEEWKKTKQ